MRRSPATIPTPRFNIKQPTPGSRWRIFLVVRFDKQRVQLDTGHKFATLEEWDAENQRLKLPKVALAEGHRNEWRRTINNELDAMYARVHARLVELRNARQPFTAEAIREAAQPFRVMLHEKNPDDYTPAKAAFLKDAESRFGGRTVENYTLAFRRVEELATLHEQPLQLSSFTLSFFDAYWQRSHIEYEMSPNSFWGQAKSIRAFLKWCEERRVSYPNVCTDYRLFKRSALPEQEEHTKVYLSEEELDRIERLELPARQAVVRDAYLFMAETAMRYGDSQRIGPEHRAVDEDGFPVLRYIQEKTKKLVEMPLTPRAIRILDRYSGRVPCKSNTEMNDQIKEVCRLAGITTGVLATTVNEGERATEMLPKWRVVTVHTAKASFITNALLRGVSLETVMELTTNTRHSIQAYIRLTKQDAKRQFRQSYSGNK